MRAMKSAEDRNNAASREVMALIREESASKVMMLASESLSNVYICWYSKGITKTCRMGAIRRCIGATRPFSAVTVPLSQILGAGNLGQSRGAGQWDAWTSRRGGR